MVQRGVEISLGVVVFPPLALQRVQLGIENGDAVGVMHQMRGGLGHVHVHGVVVGGGGGGLSRRGRSRHIHGVLIVTFVAGFERRCYCEGYRRQRRNCNELHCLQMGSKVSGGCGIGGGELIFDVWSSRGVSRFM